MDGAGCYQLVGTRAQRCNRPCTIYYVLYNDFGECRGPIGRCDFHPWKIEDAFWHVLRTLTPEHALVESVQES